MPIYMKIEGVTGSGTGKYQGWIELTSAQLNPNKVHTSGTARGVNREESAPSVSEIVVTKSTDIASTALYRDSLGGQGMKVVINFVKDDNKAQVPYLAVELENTMISNYSVSGHGGTSSERPMESLSLNFTKITYSTTPVAPSTSKADIKDRAMWNLMASWGPWAP